MFARCRRLPIAAPIVALIASLAGAQTGPFVPAQEYFGFGTNWTGVQTDPQVQNFMIDRDGNGSANDAVDTSHPIPTGLLANIASQSYRLNPERDRLIIPGLATGGGCNSQRVVYVYEIPTQDGAHLIPMQNPLCLDEPIANVGFFDDPSWSTQRIFFVAERANSTTLEQEVRWVDLVTGVDTQTDFAFEENIAAISFAPTGIAALVQYDTGDDDNFSDYRLIELCADGLGTSYNPTGTPPVGLAPPVATGNVIDNAGTLVGQIVHDGSVIASADLDDCQTLPPLTGACCFADGTCADGMMQADCEGGASNGTYQGDGSTCASADCPAPQTDLSITGSGPAALVGPGEITYTLNYQNDGDLDAVSTQIYNFLPPGTSFVSASPGGSYFSPTNLVTWQAGTVLAGGGGSVSLTVSVGCGVAQVTNFNYSMFSASPPGELVPGSPAVVTTVPQPSSTSLSVDLVSSSDAGGPILREGTATHVLTLADTSGELHANVSLAFWLGSVWNLDAVLDDGGGSVSLTTNRLSWTGDVPANGQLQIALRTIVPPCTSPNQTSDALNQGSSFDVTNECDVVLGTFQPQSLPLAPPPLEVTLSLLNGGTVTGNSLGPVGLMRAGSDALFEMVVSNTYPVGLSGVDVQSNIMAPLTPASNPPWDGTPPAGATWDAATATVGWAGTLSAGESVVLRWSASVPAQGACQFVQSVSQSSGSCVSDPPTNLVIYTVPEATTVSHLVGSTPQDGLFRYRPGIDNSAQSLLCIGPEFNHGLGVSPDGEIWVMGFPMIRFDPTNLELEFLDIMMFSAMDLDVILDVAVSPDGNTIYLGGYDSIVGNNPARILAWDRTTDQLNVLFAETPGGATYYGQITDLEVADDGIVFAGTPNAFLRIDPADPSGWQEFSDPNFIGGYWALALDTDGDLLATPHSGSGGTPRPLWSIDSVSGVFTQEIADLNSIQALPGVFVGLSCDENGQLWMARDGVGMFTLDRAAVPPTLTGVGDGSFFQKQDIAWVAGSTTTEVVHHPDPAAPSLPERVELAPAVPNPFNPRTSIGFALPRDSKVRLEIHDVRGRRVRTLLDRHMPAGRHDILWSGRDDSGRRVGSGVYYLRMLADGKLQRGKLVLIE